MSAAAGSLVSELAALKAAATNADRLRAKAADLTKKALAAKAAADQAERDYRDALSRAVEGGRP